MAGLERSPARTGRKKSDEGGETPPPAEVMVRPHVSAIALPARLARLDVRGRLDELAIYGEDEVGLLDEAARLCQPGEVRAAIEERATVIRRDLAAKAGVAREEERLEGLIWRGTVPVRRPVDRHEANQLREAHMLRDLEIYRAEEAMTARHKVEKADLAAQRAAQRAAHDDIAEGMAVKPCECDKRVVGDDLVTYLLETGEEVGRRKATDEERDKAAQRMLVFPGGRY
jgi:hypothetical protein